jgi:iron complex outermembrane receptor protein
MAYLTVSQGFEPGGWNTIGGGSPAILGPNGERTLLGFDAEEATQYELGWKGSLANGRVNASVAAFFIDYDSRQFEFLEPCPSGDGNICDGIVNIGDSEQKGVELALTWQASDHLKISAAYGYIDAEWTGNMSDGLDNLVGDTPPQVIEDSATLNMNFQMPMQSGFDFLANMQFSYNGTMQGGKPCCGFGPMFGALVENPQFTVVDIQLGLVTEQWELMLNVDNLFDEEYYTDVEPFPNLTYEGLIGVGPSEIMIGTHGHPRLFTASATYRF